jgi:predicted nucleotidyltransferase
MFTQIKSDISYTPVTDDLLREIVQRIVAAFDPETVILFGSRAYGEPAEDSDVDLLVVTDALKTRSVFERHRAVSDLFPNRRFALDVLVRTPAELDQLVKQGPAFFKEIVTQGKVLYERQRRRLGTKGRSRLSERAHPASSAQDVSAG